MQSLGFRRLYLPSLATSVSGPFPFISTYKHLPSAVAKGSPLPGLRSSKNEAVYFLWSFEAEAMKL